MSRRVTHRQMLAQAGFTIIELLIATLIFTIVMLVVTVAIIQFSKQYYKGIISSTTQGVARTLIDDVSRSIQFNGGDVTQLTIGGEGYCIGSAKRYSYARNMQVMDVSPSSTDHQSRHGLVSDTYTSCTSGSPALGVTTLGSLTTPNARELLGQHMRLSKFDITGNNGVYTITARVVYGDDDLLCSPAANDCAGNGPSTAAVLSNADDLTCRAIAGSQFCAASELSTIVKKRVN